MLFDSEADQVSLRHTTRNRSGLARGAVLAAEWLAGRKGCFTFEDFVKDLVGED